MGDAQTRARIRAEAIDRANALNGAPVEGGATEALFRRYFAYQRGLPAESEERKAESTLDENDKREAPRLIKVFGKMKPAAIKPVHIYKYLDLRAAEGAPAKANKESRFCRRCWSSAAARASSSRTRAATSSTTRRGRTRAT